MPENPFSLNDIIKFFSYTALTALTVIHGFKIALETVFNFVGSLPLFGYATATAEIITTLFYGLFIYLCFIEIKNFTTLEQKIQLSSLAGISKNAVYFTSKIFQELSLLLFKDSDTCKQELLARGALKIHIGNEKQPENKDRSSLGARSRTRFQPG